MEEFGSERGKMTRQQKTIVIALVAFNVVCFCCAAPAIVLLGGSGSQQVAAQPTATATRTATALPTSTTTPIPQATSTLVVKIPPTLPPPTITPRAIEAGWKFQDVSAEGFAVSLPPNWQKVALDSDSLASYFQTLKDKNPKFATTFANISNQLLVAQFKFFAFDVSQQAISTNYLTSMNVLREALPAEMTLDAYVQANLANLTKSGFATKAPTHKRISLAAGSAEEIKYQATSTLANNEKITLSVLQYALVRGNYGYIVTFGALADQDKTYAPVFQKIIKSWQWAP